MKVRFDFTAADLAEVAERSATRSRLVRGWRVEGHAIGAGFLALVVYVLTGGPLLARVGLAAVLGIGYFLVIPRLTGPGSSRDRMLKYFREQLGGDGPFTCEVELSAQGLITRQMGVDTVHPWPKVASVEEVPGGIEFVYRPMGALLVRDRAFASAGERQEFLSLARKLLSS